MRLRLDRLNQYLFSPSLSRFGDRGGNKASSRSSNGSISRTSSRNDHRSSNSFRRRDLGRENSSASCYFTGPSDIANVRISTFSNFVFSSQRVLLDAMVIYISPIIPADNFSLRVWYGLWHGDD